MEYAVKSTIKHNFIEKYKVKNNNVFIKNRFTGY